MRVSDPYLARQPGFVPWDTHGGRRELAFAHCCPISTHMMWHTINAYGEILGDRRDGLAVKACIALAEDPR